MCLTSINYLREAEREKYCDSACYSPKEHVLLNENEMGNESVADPGAFSCMIISHY